jgi:Raf kinase inhibitor-like YbhB/YbcL family protein
MMKHRSLSKLAPALGLVALASCGADNHANNRSKGDAAVENATLTKLNLTSDAFADGQAIPAHHTCDGSNQSPPLSWGDPPPATKSFVLVIDDPDAPGGTFRHWGAFDIPASTRRIGAGQQAGLQAVNDFDRPGYGGPCPPKGHGPHHYHFKLFALGVDRLNVGPNPKVIDVENEASKHAIAQGELIGTYERR